MPAKNVSFSQRKLNPADCVTPITCHNPGTAWQNVCSLPFGSFVGSDVAANTTPDVPIVADTDPGCKIPMPTAPAPWSPAPATTGVPAFSPVIPAAVALIRAHTSGDSYTFGSQLSGIPAASATSFDQRRCVTSSSSVPLASCTSIANSPVSRYRT